MRTTLMVGLVLALIGLQAAPSLAGGGQNQGDKGQGEVVQNQIRK